MATWLLALALGCGGDAPPETPAPPTPPDEAASADGPAQGGPDAPADAPDVQDAPDAAEVPPAPPEETPPMTETAPPETAWIAFQRAALSGEPLRDHLADVVQGAHVLTGSTPPGAPADDVMADYGRLFGDPLLDAIGRTPVQDLTPITRQGEPRWRLTVTDRTEDTESSTILELALRDDRLVLVAYLIAG